MVALPDGRYLSRTEHEPGGDEPRERILVLETLGAPAAGRRRRKRPREAEFGDEAGKVPLTRATAIRAFEPFAGEDEARAWLEASSREDTEADQLIADGGALVNEALHLAGIAAGYDYPQERDPWSAAAIRLGFGTGEEVAYGGFTAALEIDFRSGAARHRPKDAMRPQARIAAVLGGREDLGVCETLIIRAERDVAAGRDREAALGLRVGLEALLVEMEGALSDPGHTEDMAELAERRKQAGDAANQALRGHLDADSAADVADLVAIASRVIRRRRVLEG